MESDDKRDDKKKSKLFMGKDSVSPQISDYYNRFGRNRGLEQYFSKSNALNESCSGSESGQFLSAHCRMIHGSDHSKCHYPSNQVRTISPLLSERETHNPAAITPAYGGGCSGDHIGKGGDSSGSEKDTQLENTDSNSGTKTYSIRVESQTRVDIEESRKSRESSPELVSENLEDGNQNLDSSLNKLHSPASSITSRKLEWDSLADVGYPNAGETSHPNPKLSTIERMALNRQLNRDADRKSTTDKRDPEKTLVTDKTFPELRNISNVGLPEAQSTPILLVKSNSPKGPNRRSILRSSTVRKRSAERGSRKRSPIGSFLNTDITRTGEDPRNLKINLRKHLSLNVNTKGINPANSIRCREVGIKSAPNILNVLDSRKLKTVAEDTAKVVKHSAVPSTKSPIDELLQSDKEIQTSTRNNVSVSAQTSQRLPEPEKGKANVDFKEFLPNFLAERPIIFNMLRCAPKHKRLHFSKRKSKTSVDKLVPDTVPVHEEKIVAPVSIEVNSQYKPAKREISNCVTVEDDTFIPMYIEGSVCENTGLSTAESFEYVPGDVYERTDKAEYSQSVSSLEEACDKIPDFQDNLDPLGNMETSTSFTKDLESSINVISQLIDERHEDTELKKRLIKRVVKILVKADYPDDDCCSHRSVINQKIISQSTSSSEKLSSKAKSCTEEQDVLISCRAVPEKPPRSKIPQQTVVEHIKQQEVKHVFPFSETKVTVSDRPRSGIKGILVDSSRSSSPQSKPKTQNPEMVHFIKESSNSTTTVYTTTPDSSRSSNSGKKVKTTSEQIYEQYLLVKKQEKAEKKLKAMEKDVIAKKMQSLRLKNSQRSVPCSSKNYTGSSVSTYDTQINLSLINQEISQLTLLKEKIESRSKSQSEDRSTHIDIQYSTRDLPSNSTDHRSTPRLSSSQKIVVSILPEESMTSRRSTSPRSPKSEPKHVHIPLLNLKKSSDESAANTLSQVEESTSSRHSDPKVSAITDSIRFYEESGHREIYPEIIDHPIHENTHRTNADIEILYSRKAHDTDNYSLASAAKQEHRCQNKMNPISASSAGTNGGPAICGCCRSNLFSSPSISNVNTGRSADVNSNISIELKKIDKVFSKYQKCKVMKSFMQEYDDLILKYQKSKENLDSKKIHECHDSGCSTNCRRVTVEQTSKISDRPLSSGQTIESVRVQTNFANDEAMKISQKASSVYYENTASLDCPSSQTIVTQCCKNRDQIAQTDSESAMLKVLVADAVTSPIEYVRCESGNNPKSASSKSSCSVRSSASSDFANKVRKVIAKEYEDLACKYEEMKQYLIREELKKTSSTSQDVACLADEIHEKILETATLIPGASSGSFVTVIETERKHTCSPANEESDTLEIIFPKENSSSSLCPCCKISVLPNKRTTCSDCRKKILLETSSSIETSVSQVKYAESIIKSKSLDSIPGSSQYHEVTRENTVYRSITCPRCNANLMPSHRSMCSYCRKKNVHVKLPEKPQEVHSNNSLFTHASKVEILCPCCKINDLPHNIDKCSWCRKRDALANGKACHSLKDKRDISPASYTSGSRNDSMIISKNSQLCPVCRKYPASKKHCICSHCRKKDAKSAYKSSTTTREKTNYTQAGRISPNSDGSNVCNTIHVEENHKTSAIKIPCPMCKAKFISPSHILCSNCYHKNKLIKENIKSIMKSRRRVPAEASHESVCPNCLENPVLPMLDRCSHCRKIDRHKFLSKLLKETYKESAPKNFPKPIAYHLVLEQSDSILEESMPRKVSSLEEVILRIPKHPKQRKTSRQNRKETLCISDTEEHRDVRFSREDEIMSTDDQVKEFSSLNEHSSEVFRKDGDRKCSTSSYTSTVTSDIEVSDVPITVEDHLRRNRPDFVHEALKRQASLKFFNRIRKDQDNERRKLLRLGVTHLPNAKEISVSDLKKLAKQHHIPLPTYIGHSVFNYQDMVRNSAKQYSKLPEIQSKKHIMQKEEYKKTNKLMASLFAKKLREKALRGVVNISHSSNIISI